MPSAGQLLLANDFTASKTVTQNTSQDNLTSATFAAGTPECGTTFVAPTSGAVKITVRARFNNDADTTQSLQFSAQVYLGTSSAGTLVHDGPASSDRMGENASPGSNNVTAEAIWFLSGLTAGSTYYLRTMHAVTGGTGIDIILRMAWIEPLPGGV